MKEWYSVFDKKSNTYLEPFLVMSEIDAVRGFTMMLRNPQTNIHNFPEDYALYLVGYYYPNIDNDEGIVFTPVHGREPKFIVDAETIASIPDSN